MKQQRLILVTAFLEGLNVLVVEIAGARALAPFFGASLKVWTAQITATLLFLACGYAFGGALSRKAGDWKLPAVFWGAGLWLALFPLLRAPILGWAAMAFGVAAGSFVSSCLLFGFPLLCLGAVSPLLISALGSEAGSASGRIFFTNTLGGMAGGWLTALVLIPSVPLRLALAGSGLFLVLLGAFWSLRLRRSFFAAGAVPLVALLFFLAAPKAARSFNMGHMPVTILETQQAGIGLIQILEQGTDSRTLLVDGIIQGGMDKASGTSMYEFTAYLDFLSHRFQPQAKKVLLLGLGTGLLARLLSQRGLDVTVAEIEPRMPEIAKRWFGLPDSVHVACQDGRAYLRASTEKYDVICLDAFAGECSPWYLSSSDAFKSMHEHLNPGGCVLVNTITWSQGGSPGMAQVESGLLGTFAQAKVYVEQREDKGRLVNAILVAGDKLEPSLEEFKGKVKESMRPKLEALLKEERPAVAAVRPGSDDFSNLDYAEADLRAEWRKLVLQSMGPEVLGN